MASASVLSLFTFWNVLSALFILLLTRRVLFLYEWFFVSPLRHFPTRYFGYFFPFPAILRATRGKAFLADYEKHEDFGSVVRVGPNVISVIEPEMARLILAKKDFPKPKIIYERFRLFKGDPDNIFRTTDRTFHRRGRRLVTPAFSIKYLNNLEQYKYSVWGSFEKKVKQSVAEDGWAVVDMAKYYHNLAMDIIGETAFGSSFGMVDSGTHPLVEDQKSLFQFAVFKLIFPFLQHIPWRFLPIAGAMQRQIDFLGSIIRDRVAMNAEGKKRDDILQMLLDYQDPETGAKMSPQEVGTNANLFNAAGSETTANSLGWTTYFLCKNPTTLSKLRAELDAAFPNGLIKEVDLATLKTLPYLDACIKEAMRLKPVAPGVGREFEEDMEVTATAPDGKVTEVVVPKGTLVLVNFYTMHRSPKIWLRPTEYFPDRWLQDSKGTADEEAWGVVPQQRKDEATADMARYGYPKIVNRDAFWPFSAGSRDCIGKNFAMNEMRILLAHLVRRFDMEPGFDPSEEIDGAQFITLQIDRKGGLPVRLRERKA